MLGVNRDRVPFWYCPFRGMGLYIYQMANNEQANKYHLGIRV